MSTISAFRQNDPYEQLIQQMLAIEAQPKDRLIEQKGTKSRIKTVISDVNSNLSALHTIVKDFKSVLSNPFDAKSATVADGSGFSISAGSKAAYGSHSLEVLRLASADTRISKQMTSSGTDLRSFFDTNGQQTFSVEVAHPIDGDPDNRVAIDVTVDPVGTTDGEIMDEIRAAIKTSMDAAVDAGTIEKDEAANASVVKETSSTSRLSLKSGQTGFTNRLAFTDSSN
ncbi:MAG: flagellar cap protein FliD N-terminal domain-containing protein [Rhodothermales bacterium]